jgi:hypothetical protein
VTLRDHHPATTEELLDALQTLGFARADRLRLRFCFDAQSPAHATELSSELRAHGCGERVHALPQAAPGGGPRRWGVVLKTPPTPLDRDDLRRLDEEMKAIASRDSGRRYLGWKPMLEPKGRATVR